MFGYEALLLIPKTFSEQFLKNILYALYLRTYILMIYIVTVFIVFVYYIIYMYTACRSSKTRCHTHSIQQSKLQLAEDDQNVWLHVSTLYGQNVPTLKNTSVPVVSTDFVVSIN